MTKNSSQIPNIPDLENLKKQLIGQEHLLNDWDQLNPSQKYHLAQQIQNINPQLFQIQRDLVLHGKKKQQFLIEPFVTFSRSGNATDREEGLKIIKSGAVGCLIVAGGQGTRLHFHGPKGLFPISPIKHKSLFQLFSEKTIAAGKQAGVLLPLAIMTSKQNHSETIKFFKNHGNFGLKEEQISFFTQEELPMLDQEANLFLSEKGCIAAGPNGNGSSLKHFYESGIWKKWKDAGVKCINYILIDNPLTDPFDAELIGFQARMQSEVVVKCIQRKEASENVGLLVRKNGKVEVVEYTELSQEEKMALNPDFSLKHICANISVFCLTMDFIKKIANQSLPWHLAFKAVPGAGNSEKMAWKFETFIFDILPFAEKVDALLYPREECFAPLKNFSGMNSPEMVAQCLINRDRRVLSKITGIEQPNRVFELAQEFHYPTPTLLADWKGKKIPDADYIEPEML